MTNERPKQANEQLERAAILAAASYDNPFDEPAYDKRFHDGFIAGANYASSLRWVSVDTVLPPRDEEVLTYTINAVDVNTVAYFDGADWYTIDGEHIRPHYWMPIPALPQQSNTEQP